MTGGPALTASLQRLPERPRYVDYARALDEVWRARLNEAGDKDSCTTHFSVVDRHGNLCAVTQTLLSIFGSRVVSPATGLLLNNGVMWFDPEPGKPNSLAPDKRVLANYCPVVGVTADDRQFALGASGGRKILGAVLQLSSFLMAHGLSLEQAFHQPRIDVSGGGQITCDRSLPAEIRQALAEEMAVATARRTVYPYAFACPAGVLREGGSNMGCTEIMSPWGDAVHEGS
jgi:gamma-glutamyltranspeptidase/glutathione hydrolase